MNLQLFAFHTMKLLDDGGGGGKKKEEKKPKASGYDPNSVVDYLKQQGLDSSYSARKDLAKEYNIQGYEGSGTQNTQLLNALKGGGKPNLPALPKETKPKADKPKADKPKADNTPAPAVTPAETTPVFTQSADATAKEEKKDEALNAMTGMTAPSINPEYMQVLNTPFNASPAYTEAMSLTNAMKEKLLSGRTSYTDQIQSLLNQIQNRDKFSYDVDTDMLFQQALASAMGSGQQAMQNTIGQASALTGGYASTYATSAGNQAYNAYIQDAYNNLPEYYQMALEAYNMEGQDMYNQLSMLSDADATEYGRMLDSYNVSYTEANDMYNREYGAYVDNWNNTYNMAKIDLDQQGMAYDQAYNNYNVLANDYNTMRNNEFDSWTAGLDNKYRYDVIASNEEQANLDRIHDSLEAGLDRKFKTTEAEKDRQHDYNMRYDLNSDGVVNEADKALEDTDSKKIDQKHMTGAVEAMNGGGITKLNEFLNSLSGIYSEAELENIAEYAGAYSTWIDTKADYDWKMVDDGGWKLGKLDDTAKVSLNGNEMTIQALYEKLLEQGMTKKEAKDYIVALQNELGI